MKKKLIVLSGFILASAPVMALAQVATGGGTVACDATSTGTITGIICKITQILNAVVPLLIALGIVYFVWGVVSYVIASDEEAKKSGRDRIIYGIIGLAVIVSVWGLVNILVKTFVPEGNRSNITLPTIN